MHPAESANSSFLPAPAQPGTGVGRTGTLKFALSPCGVALGCGRETCALAGTTDTRTMKIARSFLMVSSLRLGRRHDDARAGRVRVDIAGDAVRVVQLLVRDVRIVHTTAERGDFTALVVDGLLVAPREVSHL